MARIPELKFGRAYLFALVALAFIGWGLYAAIDALRPPVSVHVRLGAGSSVARRFQIAETFAAEARNRDLYVEVVATKGFEDSVRQVAAGDLDLAMVSSGLQIADCKHLRAVAGLDIAPLHILVRRELVDGKRSLVEMIRGSRVNLGQAGTNDFMLADDIVRYLRLSPIDAKGDGDYALSSMSKDALSELARKIQSQIGSERQASLRFMPDVIMTVASLPGVLVQDILDTDDYCLVPFAHAEPFLMSELHHVGGLAGSVDRAFVEPTTVHGGMYLSSSQTPAGDCPTVGLRTLLVARADLPAATVKRVMQTVFETEFLQRARPRSPCDIAIAYQTHPAAQAYLDRNKPLITGTFFESVSKFLSIFGAFSAGALSIYGYVRRRRIRRPGEYLDEIRRIDALVSEQHGDAEPRLSPDALARQIDARLNQLKEQVMRDYCENRVQGEMVLLSILSTLADSRSRLNGTAGRSNGLRMAAPTKAAPWADAPDSNRSTGRAA